MNKFIHHNELIEKHEQMGDSLMNLGSSYASRRAFGDAIDCFGEACINYDLAWGYAYELHKEAKCRELTDKRSKALIEGVDCTVRLNRARSAKKEPRTK